MEAIRTHKIVEKDGEITVKGLPFRKGQHIEMIFLLESSTAANQYYLTAGDLLHSNLIGLWEDRENIYDSASFARQLREQAQRRQG